MCINTLLSRVLSLPCVSIHFKSYEVSLHCASINLNLKCFQSDVLLKKYYTHMLSLQCIFVYACKARLF